MAKPKEGKGRPSNCANCNKRLSKKNWYYRNGNYFCNKKCFKAYVAKIEEKKKETEAKNA
jgi:hypothetical protein